MCLGEWLQMMVGESGIQGYRENDPYYLNIPVTDPYYPYVQAAVEWGILDGETAFDPSRQLNRDWAVYTLVNFAGFDLQEEDRSLRDIGRSEFPKHISTACVRGMIIPDSRNRVYPEQILKAEEAMQLWNQVLRYVNHRTFTNTAEKIVWNESNMIVETEILDLDSSNHRVVLREPMTDGTLIHGCFGNSDLYGRVYGMERREKGYSCTFEPAAFDELVDALYAEGEYDLDFSQAVLVPYAENTGDESAIPHYITPVGYSRFTKEFNVNGYDVILRLNSAGLNADISRTLKSGMELSGSFELTGVHPVYRWKSEKGHIEYGYFAMQFQTSESMSISHGFQTGYQKEIEKMAAGDAVNQVISLFQDIREVAQLRIPLCALQMPVPSAPMLKVTIKVELVIGADGTARVALAQDNQLGIEIRNDTVRIIHDTDPSAEVSICGKGELKSAVMMGFGVGNMTLTDIGISMGAEFLYDTVFHLYDGSEHTTVTAALPNDYASESLAANGNVLVCGNLDAQMVLDLSYNSSETVCGRMGLGRETELLKGSIPILDRICGHYENGIHVPSCTRTDRKEKETETDPVISDTLQINVYHLILDPGESGRITVTALPEGYSRNDLVTSVADTGIASAGKDGTVRGINSGGTVVTISTPDKKYSVSCTVLVRTRSSS